VMVGVDDQPAAAISANGLPHWLATKGGAR
jgi:hypothetical protein